MTPESLLRATTPSVPPRADAHQTTDAVSARDDRSQPALQSSTPTLRPSHITVPNVHALSRLHQQHVVARNSGVANTNAIIFSLLNKLAKHGRFGPWSAVKITSAIVSATARMTSQCRASRISHKDSTRLRLVTATAVTPLSLGCAERRCRFGRARLRPFAGGQLAKSHCFSCQLFTMVDDWSSSVRIT